MAFLIKSCQRRRLLRTYQQSCRVLATYAMYHAPLKPRLVLPTTSGLNIGDSTNSSSSSSILAKNRSAVVMSLCNAPLTALATSIPLRKESQPRHRSNASTKTITIEPCVQCRPDTPDNTTAATVNDHLSRNSTPIIVGEDRLPFDDEGVMRSTFYRRPLPKHLVAFDSAHGKQFFRRCLDTGHAEGYFHLADNFSSQSEPAYCGPSSLAMVLNALQIDPRRRWKGAWRWYTDELLESCLPMSVVKRKGITFSQFACIASGHCEVVAKRPTEFTFDDFLADLRRVTSRTDNGEHMVVSYARATLGQTGDGHFSPIGAFYPGQPLDTTTTDVNDEVIHRQEDHVLVLDVARFKYPSYFCQTRLLYEAMKPIDRTTGKCRGWFLLRPQQHSPVYGCASVCKDWA